MTSMKVKDEDQQAAKALWVAIQDMLLDNRFTFVMAPNVAVEKSQVYALQLQALTSARQEGLEQAAKYCRQKARLNEQDDMLAEAEFYDDIADAILALKEPQ